MNCNKKHNPEIVPLPNFPPDPPKKSPEIKPVPEKTDPPLLPEIKPSHNPEIIPRKEEN